MEKLDWQPPIPFHVYRLPSFPTEALPGAVAAYVEAVAETTQTPVEMAASSSLGVLATALQGRYNLQITPDWLEPLCLYLVSIALPGERKSAVLALLLGAVYEYERDIREQEREAVAANQSKKRMLEQRLLALEKAAASSRKAADREQAKVEAQELAKELASFQELHPFRLLADDSTPEALAELMGTQGGNMAIASAEGGIFDTMSGRYDKAVNLDLYLKSHAGETVTVDRVGRKGARLENPRLTMILAVQPSVLEGFMGNSTMRGRGLCARYLFTICNSIVGHREVDPPTIPPEVKAAYRQFVHSILADQDTGVITLSAEAHRCRIDYARLMEERLNTEYEFMSDWTGKLTGAMLRIAALIHAAECQQRPSEVPISGETLLAAIKIAEFFLQHGKAAFSQMGANTVEADAKYLLRRVLSVPDGEITRRNLFNLVRGKFRSVEAMAPALAMLVDMGYIKEFDRATGARPTKIIVVNPLAQNEQYTQIG